MALPSAFGSAVAQVQVVKPPARRKQNIASALMCPLRLHVHALPPAMLLFAMEVEAVRAEAFLRAM